MSDEAIRERLKKWRNDNHRVDYMDDVDVCAFTASEIARDRAALAAPGAQPPQSEVPEGCSARLIHGFEAFEHAKVQAAEWMATAQKAQAALALAEQEKQALRAEVAAWKATAIKAGGALVERINENEAAPEPSKPEDMP